MTSVGYNTAAMAQRYFSVEDERAARKVALLCFSLFLVGAFIWFVPPLAMRVLHPDLTAIWPGLSNPHESSYALAALTLLPTGLVGIMLAAMFSATMSSLSGVLNLHASIISRDIVPTLFPHRKGGADTLRVAWAATFGVGVAITAIALTMAAAGASVFASMVTFNTVMSLAYGPPALLGLVVKRTPWWSGLAAFTVALAVGCVGSFGLGWGLVTNVLTVVPASVAVFFLTALVPEARGDRTAAREALFRRLDDARRRGGGGRPAARPHGGGLPVPEPHHRPRGPPVHSVRVHRASGRAGHGRGLRGDHARPRGRPRVRAGAGAHGARGGRGASDPAVRGASAARTRREIVR